MAIIAILIMGCIVGVVASIAMRTDQREGVILNAVVGISGALIGGALLTPLVRGAPITSRALDLRSLLVSFLGAIVLLVVSNIIRRWRR